MRKMATLRKIDSIDPIPDADAIEVATVGGWKVVVKKGEFNVGDLAFYFEIDSWVPHELAPFLSKGQEPREYNGVRGERLRTVKLRGTTSQGLLLPCSISWIIQNIGAGPGALIDDFVGLDVSEKLGIQKYEPPIPAQLSGQVKGNFPSFIPKTDQERIQNLTSELQEWIEQDDVWEVTEKLDGSSMTVFVRDEEDGVCSRNLNLKETEENSLWKLTRKYNILEKIRSTGRNLAVQGELIGEGIQKNKYGIRGQDFFVFDIFDIDEYEYLAPKDRLDLCTALELKHVPLIDSSFKLAPIETLLQIAEGKSVLNEKTEREGLVFKHKNGQVSFKAISNKFLLKNGE